MGFTCGYTIIKDYMRERLQRDLDAMRPLPASPFDACDQESAIVTAQSLARYKTNDYSVLVAYDHQDVWVRDYVGKAIVNGAKLTQCRCVA